MRRTLFLLGILCASVLPGLSQAGKSIPVANAAHQVTIPFELVTKHVVVKVKVNNSRPLPFILDTGDKFAIIDLDRAKELGLSLKGDIQSGGAGAAALTGSFVQGSPLTIPGLEGFSQQVTIAFPLKSLAAALGQEIDGILGSEFIKEFVTEIDYQAGVIRLHDKERFRYSGSGESIPIELNADGHPIIEADVTPGGGETLKGKFVLDLGSNAPLALYSPFVAQHHLLGPNLKTIRALGAAGVGGQTSAQIGRVAELRIGRFTLAGPITLFSQDKAGAFASADIQGNVGEQILSRFTIFLDYGRCRVILEPNKTLSQPFAPALAGFSLEAEGSDYKTFRITDVLENSPASEAGLQRGDVITAVDSRPAFELSLSEMLEMFERSVSYSLNVKRGNISLRVTLRPRNLV
jgi:hypothetical protein